MGSRLEVRFLKVRSIVESYMRVFFICHICIVSYGGWVGNEAGGPGLPILGGKVPKTRARTPTLYTTFVDVELLSLRPMVVSSLNHDPLRTRLTQQVLDNAEDPLN